MPSYDQVAGSPDPRRALKRVFTLGHSAATMEKRADVRTVSSDPGLSTRRMPSSCPPIRSMAALMPVLVSSSTPDAEAVELHPLSVAALERLEPYWPGLGASAATS